MAASDINLVTPKENLENVLGVNSHKYWRTMRTWYKNQISKEQFDSVAKELVGESNIYIHNEFVLALLLKCQQPQRSSPRVVGRRKEAKTQITHFGGRVRAPTSKVLGGRIGLASQDRMLPDIDNVTSQCLTGAWEHQVDIVSSDTVALINNALQIYIQNLLTTCVRVAKSYQITEHGIPYGFNQPHPTNTTQHLPSIVAIRKRRFEGDEKQQIAECNQNHCRKDRITMSHLIQALHTLKSQKIRLMNVERAQCLLQTADERPHLNLNTDTLAKIQQTSHIVTPANRTIAFNRDTAFK